MNICTESTLTAKLDPSRGGPQFGRIVSARRLLVVTEKRERDSDKIGEKGKRRG